MLIYLILFLTVVPLAEFTILYWIGERSGLLATIGLVIGTGILGAAIARRQGVATVARMQRELSEGVMPADSIFDGVLILLAAVLLITPGVITDSLGFLLLVPPVRSFVKHRLRGRFIHRIDEPIIGQVSTTDAANDRIIDVRVIDARDETITYHNSQ
jgi:UPF0716 protein FxsA